MAQLDYVQRFIDFLENYKDESGKPTYLEEIRRMARDKEKLLIVYITDIYSYDPILGIKVINDELNNDNSLMRAFFDKLVNLINITDATNKVKRKELALSIPLNIDIIKGQVKRLKGYVALVGHVKGNRQKVGIIPLPEDIVREVSLPIFIVSVKDELIGKLNAGDMMINGHVKKSDIVIDVDEINIDQLLKDIKLPANYTQRIINFIEYYKGGKYKKIIDEAIEEEKLKIVFARNNFREFINDLMEYDMELAIPLTRRPNYILAKYTELISFYFSTRLELKKGWLKGAKLEGEKVILSSDFLKEESIELEELIESFGATVTKNGIVISFDQYIRFLALSNFAYRNS